MTKPSTLKPSVINARGGAPVPATTHPKCQCCNPSEDLMLAKKEIPFALCPKTDTVYKREDDGVYSITDYSIDAPNSRILDADGKQVFPEVAPSATDLLDACRKTADCEEETGGGSKPDTRQRDEIDLSNADYH